MTAHDWELTRAGREHGELIDIEAAPTPLTAHLTEPITYGQGSHGQRCLICEANDYHGEIKHKPGCAAVTRIVKALRKGSF